MFGSQTAKEMEGFLADLHRQLLSHGGSKKEKTISFEIVFVKRFVHFFLVCQKEVEDLVTGQIYAHFPGIEIEKTGNYIDNHAQEYSENFSLVACEIGMKNKDLYPIKTYFQLEKDSLVGLSGIFSKISRDESIFIQLLLLPIKENTFQEVCRFLRRMIRVTIEPSGGYQAMEAKFDKLYFQGKIIICCSSPNPRLSRRRLSQVIKFFDGFDNDPLNGLEGRSVVVGKRALDLYIRREMRGRNYFFNIEEVASLYHFPGKTSPIANIIKVSSKKAEPPENLPQTQFFENENISTFGLTNFRNTFLPFGIKRIDRARHMYFLGKTGVGKSKLLELLMLLTSYSSVF